MKAQRIRLIIILVLVSLVALIGVQFFWATSSFRLSKKTFESNVQESMKKTIQDYTKLITCFELFSKVRIYPQQGIYMLRHSWLDQKFVSPDSMPPDTIPMFFSGANERLAFDYNHLSFSWPVDMEMILRFEYLDVDSPNAVAKSAARPANINVNNFRERLSGEKTITQRYEPKILDSLLRINLQNFSITDSFQFGYIRNDTSIIGYLNPGASESKLYQSNLRFPLGVDQYFSQPYDLVVYFNNQDELILAGLKVVLILSLLVVSILIASFYYSIRLILRQRKFSELKNDFINNMTHEFKTPLANISIALETLNSGNGNLEKREKILQIIGQENERLQENVEKILQVAKFEQGGIQLSYEELDTNQLVKKSVSYFVNKALEDELEINYILGANPSVIQADETHLINVLCNLIDNAIKYSHGKAKISIRTGNYDKGVTISVKDQGIGMKEEIQKKVFEKFYRATTGNIHDAKGFGLGLSYVKSIMDSHKGSVEVKSQLGKGSTFILKLPFRK